jgi:hypothetical protein
MPSSRQVVAHRRQPTGRSIARPAPISAISTQNSVRWTATAPWATGSGEGRSSTSVKPSTPAATNTMGIETGARLR